MQKRRFIIMNNRKGGLNSIYKMSHLVRYCGPEDDDDETNESSDDPWFTDVTLFEE